MKTILFSIICILLLISLPVLSNAQQPMERQKVSVWLPDNVKIDGNSTKWDNHFKAYNHSTELYYTIANDDKDFYLIIHVAKNRIIEKVVEGGISLMIDTKDKLNEKRSKIILFPVLPLNIAKTAIIAAGKSLTGKSWDTNTDTDISSSFKSNEKNQIVATTKANQIFTENLKQIKVTGLEGVHDTLVNVNPRDIYFKTLPLRFHQFQLIPINNIENIKAAISFDNRGELTYELKMPLKLILNEKTKADKLFYRVTINGRGLDSRPGNVFSINPPGTMPRMKNIDMETSTDFSGEYTLAKAP